MESPVKKLDLAPGKENASFDDASIDALAAEIDAKKPVTVEAKTEEKDLAVAKTVKPEQVDEPLLQENPQRFVLFPIKYHEVSRDAF
jgi:ribonucleoside-diphosphate reductase subunit M2